ncbi:Hypothetical predicted protein [Scomber scombrus]|uniref:Uncharacterized protein n=1 Tax=Scomber scombrus TaxID=13677 RepID=A0AAV1Q4U8_SCOSC
MKRKQPQTPSRVSEKRTKPEDETNPYKNGHQSPVQDVQQQKAASTSHSCASMESDHSDVQSLKMKSDRSMIDPIEFKTVRSRIDPIEFKTRDRSRIDPIEFKTRDLPDNTRNSASTGTTSPEI